MKTIVYPLQEVFVMVEGISKEVISRKPFKFTDGVLNFGPFVRYKGKTYSLVQNNRINVRSN